VKAPFVLSDSYRVFVTAGAAPPAVVVQRVRRDAATLTPGAVTATEAVVAAGISDDGFHRRRIGYRGPVAALWGDADRVVPPRHARGVQRAFPQAALSPWPRMGHHPQRERLTELAEFVETACLRGAGVAPEGVPQPARGGERQVIMGRTAALFGAA
jgi:pimeloyl-ACP methyl ester carboxylesterase